MIARALLVTMVVACRDDRVDQAVVRAFVDPAARFQESRAHTAQVTAKKFAFEAYPMWSMEHPARACPDQLAELYANAGSKDGKDPWGVPYRMRCGADMPAGVRGLAIQSAGPDGKFDDADDIKSWE
ncbi:MAG: hypothetical protein NT062_08760 [Proteobacteria bacterium]|nr:hypothetical protein [Pseudomonadota bacterium]